MTTLNCPNCGEPVHPLSDSDWGRFGEIACDGCGWEAGEAAELGDRTAVFPNELGDFEATIWNRILRSGGTFACREPEVVAACRTLTRMGMVSVTFSDGEFRYSPKDRS